MRLSAWAAVGLLGLIAMSGVASAKTVEVLVGHETLNIGMEGYLYRPGTIVIYPGDMVTWKANTNEPHSVTQFPEGPGSFDSTPAVDHNSPEFQAFFGPGGLLAPGTSYSRWFNETGTFPYFCLIHPGMEGVIRVVNATSQGTTLPIGGGNASGGHRQVFISAGMGGGDYVINRFAPADVTIGAGTLVVWSLTTTEVHTVTGAPANPDAPPGPGNPFSFNSSPNLGPPPPAFNGPQGFLSTSPEAQNKQFQHTFDQPGIYQYFCKLHPPMWGTVIVLERPAQGTTSMGPGTTVTPPTEPSRTPGLELPALLGVLALAALARRRS